MLGSGGARRYRVLWEQRTEGDMNSWQAMYEYGRQRQAEYEQEAAIVRMLHEAEAEARLYRSTSGEGAEPAVQNRIPRLLAWAWAMVASRVAPSA
jgi:hypothetical protein